MANKSHPFHMKEMDEDVPILPKDTTSSRSSDNMEFVDVKDVQTDPDICRLFSRSTSLTELTLY